MWLKVLSKDRFEGGGNNLLVHWFICKMHEHVIWSPHSSFVSCSCNCSVTHFPHWRDRYFVLCWTAKGQNTSHHDWVDFASSSPCLALLHRSVMPRAVDTKSEQNLLAIAECMGGWSRLITGFQEQGKPSFDLERWLHTASDSSTSQVIYLGQHWGATFLSAWHLLSG